MTGSPLEGVLVADFSRVLAGPLATMTLADLGATVVKVEQRAVGDDTRNWGPPWSGYASSYFESVNRSKRSIVLDLDRAADLAAARELARRADVVVENFRPGTLRRFGLAYEQVLAANRRVVFCSISGFGTAGGADLAGYDFIVQAVGGLMSITGEAAGEPLKVGVALVDVLTGKDAAIGILAALRHRHRTEAGQYVQVNLMSSLLGALVNQAAGFLATGSSPGRMGNQHPSIAPYETLRCEDGLIAVAAGNDRQFRTLAAVLGLATLADDPRFATNPARVENREALRSELEFALSTRTATAWEERLHAVGVACGRVNDIGAAIEYAAQLGLDPVLDVGPGRMPQLRNPVTLTSAPLVTPTPPPALGEHTDEVLAWLAADTADPLPALRRVDLPSPLQEAFR